MLRFFNKSARRSRWLRRLVLAALILLVMAAALGTALYFYLDSDQFRDQTRRLLEETLSRQTGATVSLDKFEWDVRRKRFLLENVTLRGSEPAGGPPLAHIERIEATVELRDLLNRRAHLSELIIERPQILLILEEGGKTNVPVLASRSTDLKLDYAISIDEFKIVGGSATINARPIAIDFAITKLNSALKYRGDTGVLSGQLRFDGTAKTEGRSAIPYTLVSGFDYTAGSVLLHRIEVTSDASHIKAQGRIDRALTQDITGQLEYTGLADSHFLKRFIEKEKLEGTADVTGRLTFSRESLSTSGSLAASRVGVNDWIATALKAQFAYDYPEGKLTVSQFNAETAGGTAEGSIAVTQTAAPSRVTVDLRYHNIDTAALERVYPWDPQYRVYSRLDGGINGWFEGHFERYLLKGTVQMTAYPPNAIPGTVAIPVDGQGEFTLRPGSVALANGQARFFSTAVEADGVIGSAWDVKVKMTSSDLRNLFFIQREANGAGSFNGTVIGPINTPAAAGTFDIAGFTNKELTIERVAGTASIDTGTGMAELTDVRVTEGTSSITVNGKVALNGETADLRVESARIAARDAEKFDRRLAGRVEGVFAGKARLTSLTPIRADGNFEAHDLVVDKRPIGEVRADVRYTEPVVEITGLSVKRGAATITGAASYNTQAETVTFNVAAQSIDLEMIRDLGIPAGVTGVVERGQLSGSGPPGKLSIEGKDVVFREGRGGVITGDLAYAAASETMRFDVNVRTLNLDSLRNVSSELQIPASLTGTVIERGAFSGSGTIRTISVTGKEVTVRESRGATLTGTIAYNMGTEALSFDVTLNSLKLDLGRDIARDLGRNIGIPDSVLEGSVVDHGRFVGSGTARQPSITGANVTLHDSHGGTATGELAYNAGADTLTFDGNVTALRLGFLREIRPDIGFSADVLNGVVIERGHFTGSGSASQPVMTGKNVSIRESHGVVLTGELAYSVGAEKLSFDMSVASLNVDAIRDLGIPEGLTGTIERGRVFGDITGKQSNIEGSATIRGLNFLGEEFSVAQITIPRSSGSKIPVRLDAGSLNLSVEIDIAGAGFPFTGSGSFANYPIEKLARLRGETLRLTGRADRLEGLLTDSTRLRGSGRIESAEMEVQGRALKSTGPFTFDFTHDRATFSGISLIGEGTALTVGGTVSLTDKETIDLKVDGTVALALLTEGTEWPAAGELELNGRIGGTVQERDLFGIATLRNASVTPKGFLRTVTNINGEVFFNGNNVRFDDVAATIGEGKVQVQGEATIGQNQIDSMNIRIVADNVRPFPFTNTFSIATDGVLVLRGSWTEPLLEGNLEIRLMSYKDSFENFLGLISAPSGLANTESLASRLNLSLHVEGNRNIIIQNELTDAQARISLDIRGTVGSPSVTGHVEARGGTLLFQGRQYEITRGNIDFVNPFVIEPIVDVQAEAQLRNYRVILGVTGRGENIRFEMSSDPALPQLEIFSLITGGQTREELLARETSDQTGAGVSSERRLSTGAASILTDLLKSRVGGSLGLLGLERFRIDPLPIGSEKNALARITVPLQVSKDLLITYSQDLSSSGQEIIQIEYFVSKDISILATQDNGALSLDIKRRQKF